MHYFGATLTLASDLVKIQLFSEYGHVGYQIKGNEIYNIQAKISPSHTGSTGQKHFLSENDHDAYQIKEN